MRNAASGACCGRWPVAESRKKPRRKTPAQKLNAIVLRALREYGRHCLACGQHGWMPFQARASQEYGYAQRAIRRVLREVARG